MTFSTCVSGRRRLLVAASLFLALTLPGAAAQSSPSPDERTVKAQQVSPSAWFVQGAAALGSPANRNFISNAGFVVTPAGVVVIDALGSPALAREMLAEIARITPKPVTHLVVTHYHADHIYGLQEFKKRGVRVIAQRAGLEYLHSDTATSRLEVSRKELAPWIDGSTQLVPADDWIDAAQDLVVGGTRFVLQPAGPAHTHEDLVVFLPSERVLFAGDIVFRGRIPFVGQADSGLWIQALNRLIAMDPAIIVPGHGGVSTSARQDLELTRDYLSYLREAMGKAARDMDPFDEAYARTDWSRFSHLPLFGPANRMNAYNTYLLMEHEGR